MNRPDPISFDTHRFVKRLTKEGMPLGQAEALADEQVALLDSNLATKQDVADLWTKVQSANFATKENFAVLDRRITAVVQDVAVLKSDLRTLKWIISGVGCGMLTLMLGVSSLVIKIFWTV